ncbi:MAG TPA: energy transducer TonB [Pyrinomonadaceae bacterium]|nr:energy transducer TonB [Pyrinomonadaceae bacterium]
MRTLMRCSLILLFASLCLTGANAQDVNASAKVTPEGEEFAVWMPENPAPKTVRKQFQSLSVTGKLYEVESAGITFRVWSLRNESVSNPQVNDPDDLLDSCADLVWESLLKPERDQLSEVQSRRAHMSYIGEQRLGAASGRDYSFVIGAKTGAVRIYTVENRIYILNVLNFGQDAVVSQTFINSFALAGMTNSDSRNMEGSGIGSGRGGGGFGPGNTAGTTSGVTGETDYNRVFSSREVAQKAHILAKAEPSYTESARKYSVNGTVVVRAVLSATGQVTDIHVVRGLPHGLTRSAIEAARRIRFEPAQVNGRAVSQYIQIEYNFNIY